MVGPTHNYAGLSSDNIASQLNINASSNPKLAALQGLQKMKLLHDLGVMQAILPPHPKPDGNNFSASSMWAANAATVTASCDSLDRKVHITPANLISNVHRSFEAKHNYNNFNKIFADKSKFVVHKPIAEYPDEGAANHTRICNNYNEPGINIFTYSKAGRQSFQALEIIAETHRLDPDKTIFVEQNTEVISKGVFHNDVIAVGNKNVFLYHELAYADNLQLNNIYLIKISNNNLTIQEAVQSYLFNSQIVTLPNNDMALIAPMEAKLLPRANKVVANIINGDNPIKSVHYIDCKQSMLNGGGPACLRLRVVLTDAEKQALQGNIIFSNKLYNELVNYVEKYYPETYRTDNIGHIYEDLYKMFGIN